VFVLDQHNYGHALVGGPFHSYFLILASRRELPVEIKNDLVAKAGEKEFSIDGLIFVNHEKTSANSQPIVQHDQTAQKDDQRLSC
jgi:lipocalin